MTPKQSASNEIDLTQATFRASFPPIQSAIKIYGHDDGMRFQMDVPESDMDEAVKLLAMRGKVLVVTVEISNGQSQKDNGKIHI